jgi:superfamily II DNA helicase RecQ
MKKLQQLGITQLNTYHAGMKPDERKSEHSPTLRLCSPCLHHKAVQDWFMKSEKGVVCATIAFAMGIDKNNIRQIHHLMMPKSIENWTWVDPCMYRLCSRLCSQEIGRAGRDGLVSECSLYLSPADVPVLEGFARGDA